jgi:methyl-accepting chemotaxis protein
MSTDSTRASRPAGASQAKRSFRNYLLVPAFQLKYTAMVVGVTVVVASVLGIQAYSYSRGQTELVTMNKMAAQGAEVDEKFIADIERYSVEADRKVALSIALGVLLLAVALGVTGIVVTHRLVGPAYRLKVLLRDVRDGHLRIRGRFRKGDELQDVFEVFQEMIDSLRAAQTKEIALLDDAIAKAKQAGVPPEAIAEVELVRERMRSALD